MNIQAYSPLGWTGWISLQSKGLSRVFNTTVKKHQFCAQLYSPALTSIMIMGKTIALTRRTFVGKVMSLLFNSCLPGPFLNKLSWHWASPIAQLVKNPPAIQETLGRIPGSGRSTGEGIGYPLQYSWASPVAQQVKNPSTMRETWVRSLGWEDLLEKGKATHSSILLA